MWSFLKSDLEELVSVVKEDTHIVLEKITDDQEAKKASAALKEAERRMGVEETYTIPLVRTTTNTINKVGPSGSVANDSTNKEDEEPLVDSDLTEALQVEAFLKELDINDCTDEISDLLERYPDTVRLQFETLVPQVVRYEEFWERFFYRCDAQRIEREWAADDERARRARAELVGTVSHFFGAAAHAVASGVANALTEDDAGNPVGHGGLKSIFGPSGRPPFVMNTAVDEDDDDEEEVLGWDDEEEDDDEVSGELSSGVGSSGVRSRDESEEQIEFKDLALEHVKEQLKQAMEERDQLHQTVELQSKEIASLKGGNDSSSQAVDRLRADVKAKDTELFNLKLEMESEMMKSTATDENGVNLAAKVKHLTGLLSAKELQLSKTQGTFTNNMKDMEESVAALTRENELLRQKLLEVASESTAQFKALEDEAASLKGKLASLEAELVTTKTSLAASQKDAASLKTELNRTKEHLLAKEQHAAVKLDEVAILSSSKSVESPDTVSSAVKVDKPTSVATKIVGGDDEEEGWGDDWD